MARKFQYAPGMVGYGTKGIDGSTGLLGLATYFSAYDGVSDTATIKNKISNNKELFSGTDDIPGYPTRIYQTGDIFIDLNAKIYQIDLDEPNLYVDTGILLTTSEFFTQGATQGSSPSFTRWSNTYGTEKRLIDTVYTNTVPGGYTQYPSSIYDNAPEYFANVKYIGLDVMADLTNYYPFQLWSIGSSNDKDALALVREENSNAWHFGNYDGATVKDISLYLDFKDVYIQGTTNIVEDLNVYGDVSISGDVSIGGLLTVYGDETVYGDVSIHGNIDGVVITGTSFTGAGTGLTGTASSLSIGGSAASAASATDASNITVNDESSDTTCFPLFVIDNTPGDLPAKINSNLIFNSNTGRLGATSFSGDGANVSNVKAAQIQVTSEDSDTTCFPLFKTDSGSGQRTVHSATNFTFNAEDGRLDASSFYGSGEGIFGNALDLSVGGNAATATNAITSEKITVINEDVFTGCQITFVKAAAGDVSLYTSTGLYYNSNTNTLSANTFSGGNVTTGTDPGHTHNLNYLNDLGRWNDASYGMNNQLITAMGDGSINAESYLTFSGHTMQGGNADTSVFKIEPFDLQTEDTGRDLWLESGAGGILSGNIILVPGYSGANRGRIYVGCSPTGGLAEAVFRNGSNTKPAITFWDDLNTGFYRTGTGEISITCAGTRRFLFESDGDFHADGNVVAYSGSVPSDIELKENIKPLGPSLDKIIALNGIEYDRKRNKNHHIGFIAQEVEKIIPEVIQETELLGEKGIFKTIRYTELIPYLVESIKEQQKMIEDLKKEINNIKKK